MKKLRTVIVTNGAYPVPAVRGGGAESLVESLLQQNEIYQALDLTLVSIADAEAVRASAKYPHTKFVFLEPSGITKATDRIMHYTADDLLHRKDHLAFKTPLERLDYIRKAAKYLASQSFDRVVLENQMALLWTMKYRGNTERYKDRYYLHIHNHPARYAGSEETAARAHKIICVSEFIGRAFAHNIGISYTEDRFSVLKNTVDEKLFDPKNVSAADIDSLKQKYGLQKKKLILFVGRLIEGKGVRELLQAYRNIETPDTVLMIVGSLNYDSNESSPYEEELKKLRHEIGEEKVILTGYVPHAQLPVYYAAADLCVFPSTCEEAAGLTVLEAMFMNRPLITTTMGGIPEYTNKDCAVLLDNDDQLVEHLRKNIDHLLSDSRACAQQKQAQIQLVRTMRLSDYYHGFVRILEE